MNGDWSGSPSGVNLFQTSLKRFSTSPHSRAISLSQKHFGRMVIMYTAAFYLLHNISIWVHMGLIWQCIAHWQNWRVLFHM